MADNLLKNPSFEEGTYFADAVGAVAIPNGWTFRFRGADEPRLSGQDTPWGQPNAGVIHTQHVPEHERTVFFRHGEHCWKIWTGASWPFYFSLSQKVALQPGARYRFTAWAFPDMVADYSTGKTYASDPGAAGVRLVARGGGQEFTTDFLDGRAAPFGQYTAIHLEFTAPAAELDVGLEAYGRYGLANNGFFFDDWSLEAIAAPAPAQTAAPAPAQAAAPAPPEKNLVMNGAFEDGQAYFTDDARDQAVPAGWSLNFQDSAVAKLPRPYGRPQTALLIQVQAGGPAGSGMYFWQASGQRNPVWLTLFQIVSGLTPGKKYRLSASVCPDFSAGEAGEVALTARSGDRTFETGWRAGAQMKLRQYQVMEVSFTAAAPRVEVMLEVRTPSASGGAWRVDFVALEPV